MAKTNNWFLVSYAPFDVIQSALENKIEQIKGYAFILHDKDVYLKDVFNNDGELVHAKGEPEIPHFHIFVSLFSSREGGEICRWFKCVDSEGKKINTLIEVVHCNSSALDYLTHKAQPEKYQYNNSDVYCGGPCMCVSEDGSVELLNETIDPSFDIVDSMCHDVPLMQLVKTYGKDFVYHYSSYKDLVYDIHAENSLRARFHDMCNAYDKVCEENDNLSAENERLHKLFPEDRFVQETIDSGDLDF